MDTVAESKITQKGYFSFPMRMMDCIKKSQRKLDQLKIKYRTIESSHSRSVPRTTSSRKRSKSLRNRSNSSSKLIKNQNSYSSKSKLVKTQSILKNSRFMKENPKFSAMSTPSTVSQKRSELPVRFEVTISSPRYDSPVFYPSLTKPTKRKKLTSNLPAEIQERNKILFSLRNEANTRGFAADHEEPPDELDVVKRSLKWLMKKKLKIEKARASLDQKVESQCPFKPFMYKRKEIPEFKTMTTKASESSFQEKSPDKARNFKKVKFAKKIIKLNKPVSSLQTSPRRFINESPYFPLSPYNNISPTRVILAHKHGFSHQLIKQSKPMLDYTKLMYKNT